jgi:hypothetical protein
VEEIKKEFDAHQASRGAVLTDKRKNDILSLAHDLPSLWGSPSTQDKDRKRILRLLIKDITVERVEAKKMVLHLRWQGGACEDIPVLRPPRYCDQIRYSSEVVDRVKRLAQELRDSKIAAKLNEAGLLSAKGNRFTPSVVRWIRHRHHILAPVLKLPGELTIGQIAEKFAVSPNVVYYWIKRNVLCARRPDGGPYYITLDPEKERELTNRVARSVKIHRNSDGFLNHAVGGAV